jgi:hypothetical protein
MVIVVPGRHACTTAMGFDDGEQSPSRARFRLPRATEVHTIEALENATDARRNSRSGIADDHGHPADAAGRASAHQTPLRDVCRTAFSTRLARSDAAPWSASTRRASGGAEKVSVSPFASAAR